MAALTTAQKKAAWQEFVNRAITPAGTAVTWRKADLEAAAGAMNDWIDTNQASFLTALTAGSPNFAGTNSTAAQKSSLFVYVVMVRQGLI